MTKDKGRGIFATQDIKAGECIIVEKPIVYAVQKPKNNSNNDY